MYYILYYFIYFLRVYFFNTKRTNYFKPSISKTQSNTFYKNKKKPQWVIDRIIKIKAIDNNLSHRMITNIFNDKYFELESVSKTYVGYTLKNYQYEILELRKKFKNKKPYTIAFNQTWGIDLTFTNQQAILGVIEHNSRKCLTLIPLRQKTSVAILKGLLQVLEQYPKPKFIRTDNEKCFSSKLIKFALWFLNIKHQTTNLNSPWENGRIERLFGTFKNTLSISQYDKNDLHYLTYSFQFWYNNIRFHQSLNYKTPESVYHKNIDEIYSERYDE